MNLVQRGSQTAKDGFKNEKDICDKFNNWKNDSEAKQWLSIMQYDLNEIEQVKAVVLHGYKADVKTTMRYIHCTEGAKLEALSKLNSYN